MARDGRLNRDNPRDRLLQGKLDTIAAIMRSYGIPVPKNVAVSNTRGGIRDPAGAAAYVSWYTPKNITMDQYTASNLINGGKRRSKGLRQDAIQTTIHELAHTASMPYKEWSYGFPKHYGAEEELQASAREQALIGLVLRAMGERKGLLANKIENQFPGYRAPKNFGGLGIKEYDRAVRNYRKRNPAALYPGRN